MPDLTTVEAPVGGELPSALAAFFEQRAERAAGLVVGLVVVVGVG